jgi:hypothetical protein
VTSGRKNSERKVTWKVTEIGRLFKTKTKEIFKKTVERKTVKVTHIPISKLFFNLLYLIKMAQAQPQSHGVNRPNPLGPYNPIRKHSEPERYLLGLVSI